MMIMVYILFSTAQFLNIGLHMSIYGPNIDEQGCSSYEDVFNKIYASPSDTKIKAVDFNSVLAPEKRFIRRLCSVT